MTHIRIDVDDEGYGEIQIGGLVCGVMPLWQIRAADMPRVTQGATSEMMKHRAPLQPLSADKVNVVYESTHTHKCSRYDPHTAHFWNDSIKNYVCPGNVAGEEEKN